MPIDDPATWAQGVGALKTAFDSIRSAIGMVKDARSLGGGTEQEKKAIDNALSVASSTTAIAEAELAKAFGYELCKCEFPPTLGMISSTALHDPTGGSDGNLHPAPRIHRHA